MAGVYIPGMEMPTSCSVCPMLEGDRMDGLCHAASKWLDDDEHWTWYVYPEGDMDDSKPCNCPLVPVPLHGDLIDRDEYERVVKANSWTNPAVPTAVNMIADRMPTVIPADEENDNDRLHHAVV